MKQYKYVHCYELEAYSDWNIVKIIEHKTEDEYDMAVIMKEDISIQKEDNKIEKLENKIDTTSENATYSERMRLTEIINKINEIIDKVNGE